MILFGPRAGPLSARRLLASLAALGLGLVVTLVVCAGIGSSGYTLLDLLREKGGGAASPGAVAAPGGGAAPDGGAALDGGAVPGDAPAAGGETLAATMIFRLRLPRLLLASIVGAALGAAGAVFQAVLRNPLADPYVLGVSGGAALGAYLAAAAGLPAILPLLPARQAAAFAGAVLTIGFIFALSRVRGRIASYPMLLIGVVTNTIYLALILFIQTRLEMTRLHSLRIWMVGAIPTERYGVILSLGLVCAAGIAALSLLGRDLNLLSAGEDAARALGVGVERARAAAVVLASFVTAAVVSVAGPIGFVGLIVPHAARLLFGPDHRLLVPASALAGAIFLAAADTAARTVMAPTELPVGVITALLGGPAFLWLYRSQRGRTYFE